MKRRSALIRKSGPYMVSSNADGSLKVVPAWPQFREYNAPGLISRIYLAEHLEAWLNAGLEAKP